MDVVRMLLALLALMSVSDAYKILVVSPLPGKSHSILGDGLVRHLARAGHEISYITAFTKKMPQNVRIVDVSENKDKLQTLFQTFLNFEAILEKKASISVMATMVLEMMNLTRTTLNNPNVQRLLKDKNEHFDLVLAEWMYTEVYSGLSAVFDCPLIWFSTIELHWRILRLIDEVPNPAYHTDPNINSFPPFTFIQRVKELTMQVVLGLIDAYYLHGLIRDIYNDVLVPIIEEKGRQAPSFEVLKYNASLVLGNSHVSLGVPFRLPDSYKAIGGFHIEDDLKPLPQDLQNLLDNAKHGVIYYSMGSNLKSKTMPTNLKQDLLKMFGELKQTVLWKFEEDLPNRPDNVHIVQWAPQPSILAHDNCILFITHGGLLSTTEAIHFGVPIVGIPIFADQFLNIGRAVKKGFAKQVDLSYEMAGDLKIAIDTVLSNPSYRQRAKELSFIYNDRPVSPGKELVHWVEHVIRTRGASHLRSPALMVPWYQKMYLDLAALLAALLLVIKYCIKYLICRRKIDVNKKRS